MLMKVLDGKLILRCFVCYKEGIWKGNGSQRKNVSNKTRISREMICGCEASFYIKRVYDLDGWIV